MNERIFVSFFGLSSVSIDLDVSLPKELTSFLLEVLKQDDSSLQSYFIDSFEEIKDKIASLFPPILIGYKEKVLNRLNSLYHQLGATEKGSSSVSDLRAVLMLQSSYRVTLQFKDRPVVVLKSVNETADGNLTIRLVYQGAGVSEISIPFVFKIEEDVGYLELVGPLFQGLSISYDASSIVEISPIGSISRVMIVAGDYKAVGGNPPIASAVGRDYEDEELLHNLNLQAVLSGLKFYLRSHNLQWFIDGLSSMLNSQYGCYKLRCLFEKIGNLRLFVEAFLLIIKQNCFSTGLIERHLTLNFKEVVQLISKVDEGLLNEALHTCSGEKADGVARAWYLLEHSSHSDTSTIALREQLERMEAEGRAWEFLEQHYEQILESGLEVRGVEVANGGDDGLAKLSEYRDNVDIEAYSLVSTVLKKAGCCGIYVLSAFTEDLQIRALMQQTGCGLRDVIGDFPLQHLQHLKYLNKTIFEWLVSSYENNGAAFIKVLVQVLPEHLHPALALVLEACGIRGALKLDGPVSPDRISGLFNRLVSIQSYMPPRDLSKLISPLTLSRDLQQWYDCLKRVAYVLWFFGLRRRSDVPDTLYNAFSSILEDYRELYNEIRSLDCIRMYISFNGKTFEFFNPDKHLERIPTSGVLVAKDKQSVDDVIKSQLFSIELVQHKPCVANNQELKRMLNMVCMKSVENPAHYLESIGSLYDASSKLANLAKGVLGILLEHYGITGGFAVNVDALEKLVDDAISGEDREKLIEELKRVNEVDIVRAVEKTLREGKQTSVIYSGRVNLPWNNLIKDGPIIAKVLKEIIDSAIVQLGGRAVFSAFTKIIWSG